MQNETINSLVKLPNELKKFSSEHLPDRILIIGAKASGKTNLIVQEIIPHLEDYVIIDSCDEYFQWFSDSRVILPNPNENMMKFSERVKSQENLFKKNKR